MVDTCILQVRRKSVYNQSAFSIGLRWHFDIYFQRQNIQERVLQIGSSGSSIKFPAEEWTFVVIFLSVTDTVFECSLLIISEEGFSGENVEDVWTLVSEFNVDVVAVAVVAVIL